MNAATDSAPRAAGAASAEPLKVLEAGQRRPVVGPALLWRYRDLLYFLTRRHVLTRYRQTFLGLAWAVLQPLMTMVVFSIFLGHWARVPSDGLPYPVFAYLGILPWTFFAGTVSRGAGSLVGNANLLQSVYFPRSLIPISATLSGFVDYGIALVVLFALMLVFGVGIAPTVFLLIPLALLTAVISTGVGMWFAAWNVRYRDVSHALPFLLQIWMFATPVVYPVSIVPERFRLVFALNPMTGVIQACRACVTGGAIDWPLLGVSTTVGLLLAAAGVWLFGRLERRFADVV